MSGTMVPLATEVDQQELAQQLLAQAREQGVDLAGPDGLLNRLTKNALETALEAEMDELPVSTGPPTSKRQHNLREPLNGRFQLPLSQGNTSPCLTCD
ncbi:hypothetical protein QFZ30_002128 [Arthrobacter pascens]|uniref:hypothetical protein n=1 Tax=Arthrobacter pascens TaxID=1677 RepID=UPI0027907483|nr:hypothetical protein [Arthrobacter pascens]